jgi:hypothetical protein
MADILPGNFPGSRAGCEPEGFVDRVVDMRLCVFFERGDNLVQISVRGGTADRVVAGVCCIIRSADTVDLGSPWSDRFGEFGKRSSDRFGRVEYRR